MDALTYEEEVETFFDHNTLEGMSDELIVEFLKYVPAVDLLQTVSRVSRRMSVVLQLVWRRQLPLQFPAGGLNLHQLQRCCMFYNNTDNQPPPSCLRMGSVLAGRRAAIERVPGGVFTRACFASTTDNVSERIENVLIDGATVDDWDFIRMPPPSGVGLSSLWGGPKTYWSSAESPSPDTNETLLFITEHEKMILSEFAIKPDTDYLNKTYSWKKLVIKVYNISEVSGLVEEKLLDNCLVRNRMRSNKKVDPDQKIIDILLDDQRPVYESQVHSTLRAESNEWQYYKLPMGVIGNVIAITLIGKNARQFNSRGFYACVRRVAALGIPLYDYPPRNVSAYEGV